jgi:Bacterial regulatory helix-turn-helix protein, lysR family
MTLDQLRIFVAVAEQQHVTRAANVLALSQSAVSSSIAALETQYDVKLFHRIRRNIVLTDAGQQFLDEARAVLARASSAGNMLADLAGLRRGALSLAASQTVKLLDTEGDAALPCGTPRRFAQALDHEYRASRSAGRRGRSRSGLRGRPGRRRGSRSARGCPG